MPAKNPQSPWYIIKGVLDNTVRSLAENSDRLLWDAEHITELTDDERELLSEHSDAIGLLSVELQDFVAEIEARIKKEAPDVPLP